MAYTPLAEDPKKLRMVFARLDDSDESGRNVAFNVATKALAAAGISWTDLLEAKLAQNLKPTASRSDFSSIFSGIFEETFARAPQPKPGTPSRPVYISGADIPQTVVGRLKEIDRRNTKNGIMVVVQVENEKNSFGPMAIFGASEIALYDSDKEAILFGQVRQPTGERRMPVLHSLRS